MSTFITFKKGGITAYIKDVCICGRIHHLLVQTGKTYESETTAVKRAIIYYRKKLKSDGLVRCRKEVRRHRTKTLVLEEVLTEIPKPRILKFLNESNEIRYLVADTGKEFKKESMALRNAIRYAKTRNIK